jgi:hypothetical protein
MRDWRELIAVVATAALVAGCQREHLVQPGTGPTAEAAPPLANEDISAIYAARHVSPIGTAPDSDIRESRAHPLPLRKSVDVATAVVLMSRLPFPDAAAVVLRRPSLWPASVIMLQEDSLSVGAFESALFALSNEVTRGGGVEAPSATQVLQIRGQELPTGSNKAGRNMDQWILDTLKQAPRRTVAGVGAYRAVLLHIGAFTAAKPDSR